MKKYDRTVMSGGQIGLTVLCSFLALILIAMIFVTAYVNHYLGMLNVIPDDNTTLSSEAIESMEKEWTEETESTGATDASDETDPTETVLPTIDPTDVTMPNDTPVEIIRHKDLVNILLVGQDRRPDETKRHLADTMIVVSINKKDKTITLTSFMRDMYVYIPGYKYNKMNAAYPVGGFSMLCETLMTNFGVAIDGCVEVDFVGFTTIIELLGGLDIELTQKEADHLNSWYGWSLKAGMNHLNGDQALGYARARKGVGDDYARTERQRKVLTEVFNKCKDLNFSELSELMETLLPLMSTNMTTKKITNYLIELFPLFTEAQISQLRIPANGTFTSASISGAGSCLVPDLEKNRQLLVGALMPN